MRSPFLYRRRRVLPVSEPVSPVRRPSTVVFQASPTNINGARATAGLEPDTTLTWGGEAGDEAPAEEA